MSMRENMTQSPRMTIFFEVIAGVAFGLTIAALLNRLVEFFFLCVFVGALASGVLVLVLDSKIRKNNINSESENFLIKIISVLVVFLTTVITFATLAILPLNVDRSFTVWTLNEMEINGKPQSRDELILESSKFFSSNSGEISRRINEQIRLRNIEVEDGMLQLSARGKLQVQIHRVLRQIFALEVNYTRSR
jgi:hypothetical protein